MTKLQNLEKTLRSNLIEAMSTRMIEQYRQTLKDALHKKCYSWFDLYCDKDMSYKGYSEKVEEYLQKSYDVNFANN